MHQLALHNLKTISFYGNCMDYFHCDSLSKKSSLRTFSISSSFKRASVFAELKELLVKVFSGKGDITFASEKDAPKKWAIKVFY